MFIPDIDIRYLSPQFFQLSKSTFVKGMQCAKYLYLNKHKPGVRTPYDAATLQRFEEGRTFEKNFRQDFEPALNVHTVLGKDVYTMGAAYTRALLSGSHTITLFEACFIQEQTMVMTDILCRHADQSYTIYELKNSDQLKPVFLWDLSVQYYVCRSALQAPLRFFIVLNDGKGAYHTEDLTPVLEARYAETGQEIRRFRELLQQQEVPDIQMGSHCHEPYECPYQAYCSRKNKKAES